MIVRISALAALLVLPAMAGCRDYKPDNESKYGKNTTPPAQTAETPTPAKPNLEFPSGTAEPGTTGMQGTIGATANEGNTLATVALAGDANGTTTFFTDSKGDIRATINLRGAPAGSYGAYLFADATCDDVEKLDKPFAAEGTTTGPTTDTRAETTKETSKAGTTGTNANETEHWTSLGTLTVGSPTAPATSTLDLDLERADLDRHVIAIFPISADSTAKPKMTSCGVVKLAAAPEGQG